MIYNITCLIILYIQYYMLNIHNIIYVIGITQDIDIQTYKHTHIQTHTHTTIQTYKRTKQTNKTNKTNKKT